MIAQTTTVQNRVRIRPLHPGDVSRLQALHERLSADTIYRRYLAPRVPPASELAQITRLNRAGGAAFAVELDGLIISVGYYVAGAAQTAEPALLIEDRFQAQGIGLRLAVTLAEHALSRGIETFVADIYPENRAVMRLIRKSGVPYKSTLAHGVRQVRMKLVEVVRAAATTPEKQTARWSAGGLPQGG